MNAKNLRQTVTLAITILATSLFADTYDEKLEFIETTGTQWIDTGLRLNFRRARLEARFRMLEVPSTLTALCGTLDKKDDYAGRDYSKGGKLFSFSVRVGYHSGSDFKCNRLAAGWLGSENMGIGLGTGCYELQIIAQTGIVNRVTTFGRADLVDYSSAYRQDALIDENKTYYIGNINNAGEGLATASGSMPKVHWYGLKLWNDDTLIGDFIPVRKAGVAGFFDNVTETFFPSQGDDPFVAPNRIVWTGEGSADDIFDGANWQGGVAPSTANDVAVFPAGVTVDGTYGDIATLGALGGIDLAGADTLLRFASAAKSATWTAPFYGKGTVLFANISSSYSCSFKSDCSAFEGLVDVSNAIVSLNRYNAFGGEKATVRYYNDVSDQRLNILTYGAPIPTTFVLRRTGQYVFADSGANFEGPVIFDPLGSIVFNGNGSRAIAFSGPMTNRSTSTSYCELNSAVVTILGEPKHLGKLRMRSSSFRIYTPLGCEPPPKASGIKNQTNLGLWPGDGFVVYEDNVFGEYASLLMNWDYDLFDSKKRWFNLNGHDQTIGTLGVHSESWFYWNDASKGHFATNTIIYSKAPATLTLTGYCRNSMLYPTDSYVFPGQLNDELSFLLDSRTNVMATAYDTLADNCGVIRFTGGLSTTRGRLASKRGLIDIRSQATFSNLTELAVLDEGKIHVRTAEIGVANDDFRVVLTNTTTGKLEIDAGLVLVANTALAGSGNGTWLAAGDYSSVASTGVKACPQLAGTGILRVRKYGGKRGVIFVIR